MPRAKKLPSGAWRVRVYSHIDPDGKQHYKSFTCSDPTQRGKVKCEQMATEWALTRSDRSGADISLRNAYKLYIDSREHLLSPSTVREYRRAAKVDFPELMDIRLSDLTQQRIQAAVNAASVSRSPKSVRNMHGLLSAVLGAYRPDFALRTDLPKKVRPSLSLPSDDDIKRLLEYVAGTRMEIPILLAAFGAMRRSEICALDSDHINGNVIHVEYAMVLGENNEWVIKRPKSYAGDRYIPLPDSVIEKLRGINGRITDMTPSQITDTFVNTVNACGLKHFRFHDLRHYSASVQHALGVPDAYIMQRGGWGSDTVLKSVYRHAMEDKEKAMNDKINSYFSDLYDASHDTNHDTK